MKIGRKITQQRECSCGIQPFAFIPFPFAFLKMAVVVDF